jgi:osmotically inducible protein OsmC
VNESNNLRKKNFMQKIEKVLYRGIATATGGREGRASSSDKSYDVKLSTPKEMGGSGGEGTNPEQMFAGGYSACFLGAMKVVAGKDKVTLPGDTSITGSVGFGAIPNGYGLEVELKISIPGMDKATAMSVIEKAHQVCPYSNATRGNIDVRLTLV